MAAASTARRTATRVRSATKAAKPKPSKPSKAANPKKPIKTEADDEAPKSEHVADPAAKPTASSAKPAAASRARATAASPAKRTRTKPDVLVQRVYNTIDGELTKLEKQKGLTSQDRERASRALSQMVNALEKAVEMQRVMTKRKPTGGDAKSKEALAHAEDLRREIAERLERLNRKRPPQRSAE
ncbi:hypothetical protein [Hyphomicrobium sp.]|uniref:hypothetical protein n=1 Tax=Hyphomicrobium sp. TaxID=82 RepID=UPI002D7A14F3|nr:hypothetical protein [Hyphomicrobium sp.]HET6390778.1 hypothetical protein [Hyphomicrobium sp.]